MVQIKRISVILIALSAFIFTSCNMAKRIYISNKTNTAITLMVDKDFAANEDPMLAAFKDSLNGKTIPPGHITIGFGRGKWTKEDEENLRKLLLHTEIIRAGNGGSFRLPEPLKIGRGIYIQELIVTVKEP